MATCSSTLGWKTPWTKEPGQGGYSPWGCTESDTTSNLTTAIHKHASFCTGYSAGESIFSFNSPVLIIFLWHLILTHLLSISFTSTDTSSLCPLARPPEDSPSLFTRSSVSGTPWKPSACSPQALATVIQSTHAQWWGEGTVGHQAASIFTMPPALFLPPSFTPETELNSLELNAIMIQHHTILFCLIQRERQQGKPS